MVTNWTVTIEIFTSIGHFTKQIILISSPWALIWIASGIWSNRLWRHRKTSDHRCRTPISECSILLAPPLKQSRAFHLGIWPLASRRPRSGDLQIILSFSLFMSRPTAQNTVYHYVTWSAMYIHRMEVLRTITIIKKEHCDMIYITCNKST